MVTRYLSVPTRLGPTPTTQAKVRRIIDGFRQDRGNRMVADVRFEHIEAIVAAKMIQSGTGNKKVGGIEAARKLRKELIRLFDFAVKIEVCKSNPARLSQPVRVARGERSKGFHTWTEEEIAQYRGHHAVGTRGRLAMELMLWTCQRRIDAIRLGRQHIRDGRIYLAQSKTGTEMGLLITPQLLEAIVAMPARVGAVAPLTFLLTDQGRPFTNPGFGNWFRDRCDEAGLPQCTAHGLRKAMMRRAAQLGNSNQSLKSLSGHTGDNEVADYTRAVDQVRLADTAIRALAAWEKSLPVANLDPEEMANR